MRRRDFLTFLAGAGMAPPFASRAAGAQTKVFRLGMIVPSRPLPGTRAFEEQLRELGYEEGRNLEFDLYEGFSVKPDGSLLCAATTAARESINRRESVLSTSFIERGQSTLCSRAPGASTYIRQLHDGATILHAQRRRSKRRGSHFLPARETPIVSSSYPSPRFRARLARKL